MLHVSLDDGVTSIALTIPLRLRPDIPILQRSSSFPTDASSARVHVPVRTVVWFAALAAGSDRDRAPVLDCRFQKGDRNGGR
jgi:hypothetical protein